MPEITGEMDIDNFNPKYTTERPKLTLMSDEIVSILQEHHAMFAGFYLDQNEWRENQKEIIELNDQLLKSGSQSPLKTPHDKHIQQMYLSPEEENNINMVNKVDDLQMVSEEISIPAKTIEPNQPQTQSESNTPLQINTNKPRDLSPPLESPLNTKNRRSLSGSQSPTIPGKIKNIQKEKKDLINAEIIKEEYVEIDIGSGKNIERRANSPPLSSPLKKRKMSDNFIGIAEGKIIEKAVYEGNEERERKESDIREEVREEVEKLDGVRIHEGIQEEDEEGEKAEEMTDDVLNKIENKDQENKDKEE